MIRIVIIEDERLIADELVKKLIAISFPLEIMSVLASVKESIGYFSQGCRADLIFSDIQLADGLSFSIFEKINCQTPVVFITGFDSFIVNAFEHNGMDYLLKPVDDTDLLRVLHKYKSLENHFIQHQNTRNFFEKRKERLVVKKGFSNVLLRLEEVVFFFTENKIVYVIDREGKKYIVDQKLSDLQTILDNHHFFRANRQYIININYIKGYKTFERVKLSVDLNYSDFNHLVVVSQETAPYFRKWINEN